MKAFRVFLLCLVLFASCRKDAGEGGTSSIIGKIHVTEYDADTQEIKADYSGASVNVYIMYGITGTIPDDFTKTGTYGSFIFKYCAKAITRSMYIPMILRLPVKLLF